MVKYKGTLCKEVPAPKKLTQKVEVNLWVGDERDVHFVTITEGLRKEIANDLIADKVRVIDNANILSHKGYFGDVNIAVDGCKKSTKLRCETPAEAKKLYDAAYANLIEAGVTVHGKPEEKPKVRIWRKTRFIHIETLGDYEPRDLGGGVRIKGTAGFLDDGRVDIAAKHGNKHGAGAYVCKCKAQKAYKKYVKKLQAAGCEVLEGKDNE